MNEYRALSFIYDSVMDNYDYDRVFHWISEIVGEKRPLRILEMAMGTGKLTERLRNLGTVTGFDASEEMLALAEARLRDRGEVQLYRMDLRDFTVEGTFDVIVCLFDGYNYLSSEEALKASFKRVRNALKEDGLFLFDLNTAYRFEYEYGDFTEIREDDDYLLIWDNFYADGINRYDLTVFLRDQDGRYERYDETHREYTFKTERIEALLEEAGFSSVESFDGYSNCPRKATSGRIAYVAKIKDNNNK